MDITWEIIKNISQIPFKEIIYLHIYKHKIMNFISNPETLIKRFLFFIGGFIIGFPIARFMMSLGIFPQLCGTPDILQIPVFIVGLALFLAGMVSIFHAFMLKE